MYQLAAPRRRKVHIVYPAGAGTITLRTEGNWEVDIEPEAVSDDGSTSVFHLESGNPFVYFKPVLRHQGRLTWAAGPNVLLLMTTSSTRIVHPHFFSPDKGSFSEALEIPSPILGRKHRLRVYLPPGYAENPLRAYPVLYMQDGKNLFFPDEAFLGREWKVDESLATMDAMNVTERAIVVGMYSEDRERDYTKPGYEVYGRAVVEEIKPYIDRSYRTLPARTNTGVMGSSLGGVVSFYIAWQFPTVFGFAACLSSTFSFRDDLIDRVLHEERRESKFYLDSGWPGDNYEVTLAMAMAMRERGYVARRDFIHFAFPLALHDEHAWGQRFHLPMQLFSGKLRNASAGRFD